MEVDEKDKHAASPHSKSKSVLCFWELFPNTIRFVISATHLLIGGIGSTLTFGSLPKLSRRDFLLCDEEAFQFLELEDIGLPDKMRHFKHLLAKEVGEVIGALRLSVYALLWMIVIQRKVEYVI